MMNSNDRQAGEAGKSTVQDNPDMKANPGAGAAPTKAPGSDRSTADTQPQTKPKEHSDQPRQCEQRMTLQKLPRWKCGSLSAITSALTLPKVVSGLCLMPS